MARLAILAGQGALPHLIAAARPEALFAMFEGVAVDVPPNETLVVSYERFGEMFNALHAKGVTEVVFAGSLARPVLDPSRFDAKTQELAPRFFAAMQGGDDGLLRTVVGAFEEHGFQVRGAHEIAEDLTAAPGLLAGAEPSAQDAKDIARAQAVLDALGAQDVGQGVVVAAGQVLGIETAQGTDAMLRFVAETPEALRKAGKGVLVKGAKPEQELRVDMPTIGPKTIELAAAAGLAGVVIDAGRVLLIDRAAILAAAERLGLFLLAKAR